MRILINNFISVAVSFFRILFFKIFRGSSFKADFIQRFSPNVVLEFNKGSTVDFGKKIRVHSGSKIKVRKGAELKIGNNVKINYYCIIACHKSITIGEGTELGPSVYIYDHDHDYADGLNEDSSKEKFKYGAVSIGKDCWIGAGTVILRGTQIGNNCVIGAGCVVNGNIPDNTVLVQKRQNSFKTIKRDMISK